MESTLPCNTTPCCFNSFPTQLHHRLETLLQLSFSVFHLLNYYVVSLLRKRCLITTLKLFFNCSSVDGRLSSSANVNSLTTMVVSQPEMFDIRRATVFFVWDVAPQITKLLVVKKFGEAIAPFSYAYAQQSFKFLQRTFSMRKLLLCFILKREKQII